MPSALGDRQDQGTVVPPIVQPRFPESPLGVLTVTHAVPGTEITAVVIMVSNC